MAIEAIKEIIFLLCSWAFLIISSACNSTFLISDATIEADERYNSIIEEAKNVARGIVSNAEEAGRKEAEVILSEGEKQCAEVSNLKGSKIDSAVNLVIERIVKTNGNS